MMQQLLQKLLDAFRELAGQIVAAVPRVVVGIVLVLAALLLAKAVEWTARKILVRVRFDSLVERVGVDKMLQRVGIRQKLDVFLPRLLYFLLLILLAKTAADALELDAISDALGTFFGYLPNLVAALLLLLIGSAVGPFVGGMVTRGAEESGLEFAPILGRLVSAAIVFVVALMAVGQLKIDTEILRIVTSFFLAGLALAFGLSFGLGTRDLTRNILAGFYARRLLTVGEELTLGDERGVLEAITPTHTVLSVDGRKVRLANAKILDEVARQ